MNGLSKQGWYENTNGQHYAHSHDFDFMKMIGRLIDCAGILKNQCGCSDLREIAPECVPLEQIIQNNDKEEDKDDAKEEKWIMGRRNKR